MIEGVLTALALLPLASPVIIFGAFLIGWARTEQLHAEQDYYLAQRKRALLERLARNE